MELQISYSVCTEIPQERVLWGETGNDLLDYAHMLVSIPPKVSVSGFMGYLKVKSGLMIYEQFV